MSTKSKVATAAVAVLATAGVVAGWGGGAGTSGPAQAGGAIVGTAVHAEGATTVAEATVARVAVFDAPGAATPGRQLANPQPSGVPLVFTVVERQPGWLKVNLPVRPNGSTGWVEAEQVSLSSHSFRVEIDLSDHRLIAYDGNDAFLTSTVAVGKAGTPTPVGAFYVKELLRAPNPEGAYGPFAFGLSGFSDVLTEFAGGEGVIGIHGTNQPAALGTDVSHGCVRVSNDDVTTLAHRLPLGTPVEIRA